MKPDGRIFFCLLLLCAGCSLHGTDPVALPRNMPETFLTKADLPAYPAEGRWWEVFADPALNRLMDAALTHNRSAIQTVERMRQAFSVLNQKDAAGKPVVDATASVSRTHDVLGIEMQNRRAGLQASYEIDVWGRIQAAEDAARFLAAASREDLAALYVSLSATVATTYFDRTIARRELALINETIRNAQQTLDWNTRRYKRGLLPLSDRIQAEAALAKSRSRKPAIAAEIKVKEHALALLTGRWAGTTLSPGTDDLPTPPFLAPRGLPATIIQNRPDVAAAWLRVQAADRHVAVAISERFPNFRLTADLGYAWLDTNGPSISNPTWGIGADLLAPLFDWGNRKARTRQQKAAAREAAALWQERVLTGFQEVSDALIENAAADRTLRLKEKQRTHALRDLALEKKRYRAGITPQITVLAAESRLIQTKQTRLAAHQALILQRIALARSIGGNWSRSMACDIASSQKD